MLWIIFSLAAALIWAMANVIDKYTLAKIVDKPVIPVIVMGVVGILFSILIIALKSIILLSAKNVGFAFLAGFCYLLAIFLYYQAVKIEEISKVIPLLYLSSIFILFIAGFTLNETFTLSQYIGVALLVCGAILISSKNPLKLSMGKAFTLMLLAAITYALNQVLTKYLLKFADFWSVFVYTRISIFVVLLPVMLIQIPSLIKQYQHAGIRSYRIMTFNQVLNLAGVLCITIAMTGGFVTLVNSLASIQPLFVLLLSTLLSVFHPYVLQEKLTRAILVSKSIAILMIVAGAVLVSR